MSETYWQQRCAQLDREVTAERVARSAAELACQAALELAAGYAQLVDEQRPDPDTLALEADLMTATAIARERGLAYQVARAKIDELMQIVSTWPAREAAYRQMIDAFLPILKDDRPPSRQELSDARLAGRAVLARLEG